MPLPKLVRFGCSNVSWGVIWQEFKDADISVRIADKTKKLASATVSLKDEA